MAKRRTFNKRLSRYSQRSSAGSGFLNPNSELLEEEEPFWWNKLSNTTNSNSPRHNITNETTKYLHSDLQNQSISANHQWWKILQSSDSSQNEKRIEAVQQEIRNKYITSDDTDEEETNLPLRKRKILIRKKPNRNISNIFKKALDDSSNSESSESNLPNNSITKHTNDTPSSKNLLQKSSLIEKQTSQIRNISSTSSIDQSHISDKILKPKHNIFRKKIKKKSYNAFENLLKTNDNSHNKSGRTETSSSDSSAELMDKNNTSERNVLDKSKEEKLELSSTTTTEFKESIENPKTFKYKDADLIHHNRTNSSYSLSSKSNESHHLEFIPDLIRDRSHTNASANVSTNQKESIVGKNTHLTMDSITSKEVRDSIAKEKIGSRETINQNETSLASMKHIDTPNKSKMENSINLRINNSNVRKTINASQHESMDERNLAAEIPEKNDKFQTSTNMASKNSIYLSNSRSTEINDFKNKKTASSISFESNNIKNSKHSQNFTKNSSMNIAEMDFISLENQIHTNSNTNSNNNSLHTANAIEDASKNKTLKTKISTLQKTSIHNISDKNEENLLQSNNNTPVKDLDMNTLSLKQKSLRVMDVIDEVDNEQNADYIDHPNHEKSNIINTGHQTKINEYFTTTNSKLVSPINARQSNHFLSNIKENKGVKKKVAQKPKINISKLINAHFTTVKNSLLDKNQIIEKIEELRNMNIQKKPEKKNINKAYIVNGKVYKRPKLPRPRIWATNRLYNFLWKKMQPKYKLLTRVHSEKFVKELSDVVSFIIKTKKYENYKTLLNNLMENMATLGIIHTPNDFYNFCYDYLPFNFRVKVVPMILPGNVRNIPYNPNILNEPILKN